MMNTLRVSHIGVEGGGPNIFFENDMDFADDDDETSPLTQDIYSGSQRTIHETKAWDVFRDLPPKQDSGSMESQKCLDFTVKVLKIVVYFVTFAVILGCGVISKCCVFLMTSQIKADRYVPYCNKDLGRDKQFVARIPTEEQVAWTWCLFFAFCVPELSTLFRSLRICFFKSWRRPFLFDFIFVCTMETLHVVGIASLVLYVLPSLDVVKGAMITNCLCFIPAFLTFTSRNKRNLSQKENKLGMYSKFFMDGMAMLIQMSGFLAWPMLEKKTSPHELFVIPATVFLISCGYWENFVTKQTLFGLLKPAWRIKDRLKRTRYFSYLFISLWKMICFFCCIMFFRFLQGDNIGNLFSMMSAGFSTHSIRVIEIKPTASGTTLPDLGDVVPTGETTNVDADSGIIIYVLVTQIVCSYLCYIFGKFACKIMIQGFSYAFPVNLTVPATLSLLISVCGLRQEDPCFFHNFIPDYLFFESPSARFLNDFISSEYAWIWLFWLVSQTWITFHLWTPKCERLATTEKLFVRPWYDSLLIDQSLALNRQRDDEQNVKTEELADREKDPEEYYETISIHTETSSTTPKTVKKTDSITRIYACATMWHETREEMMDMLKSILRMDEDQCARRVAQKYLRVVDPDYYEFETHIFLDDAFEISDVNDDWSQVNRFVKMLVATIDEAATHVHETNIRIKPPTKIPTPYGGRMMWTLPGKTKMFVHLKDKSKIRHRKRWSQVMYMYYLLGHRLMELPIPVERKEVMAENTYLLTLDGDVDFQPHAVQLLIDLMKKNRNLGAACGRIHPVGNGLMAWYQIFEYAIGHWLQKATEHMIGCVLCSPGCFSLFRGKALMDDNVMRKYTMKSIEARHYVQYDQGEDRWLCTLLLQRGYRVEYSAASDAYTHCPESFSEFFNQRRRWVPSTMANILDLLQSSRRTIKINDNISLPYVAYQFMLMGGTILGPGTIFLMLVGAFVAVFHIDNWTSFYYNITPILSFMFICFTCKSEIQLLVAHILSTIYALIMMAVIVGTALQLREDGIGSPSAIFLISMLSSFFVAALLHPQEFGCIIFFSIYLLSIPSMYLLLILYSIINLNNVTWGTREVQVKKTKQEMEQEKKAEEEAKRKAKSRSLLGFLQNNADSCEDNEEGSLELSFAGLFKCMFCTHQKSINEGQQLLKIATSMDEMSTRMERIEKFVETMNVETETPAEKHDRHDRYRKQSAVSGAHLANNSALSPEDSTSDNEEDGSDSVTASTDNVPERNDDINPFWIEDKELKKGPVAFLSPNENQFWRELIEKYLYPLDEDKTEKTRIANDLKNLRDQMVFAFFMMNALFVVIVFLLQLNKDQLHIKWPFGVKTNITYDETTQEARIAEELIELRNKCVFFFFMLNALFVLVVFLLQLNKEDLHVNWPLGVLISKEYLQLEPIGLVFVFFFAFILVIQFGGMVFHRFGTISHILASTELDCCKKKKEDTNLRGDKSAVDLARELQRLKGINGDYENSSGSSADRVGQRRTIYNLEKQKNKTRTIGTLDVAFRKRWFDLQTEAAGTPGLRRKGVNPDMLKVLEMRKRSIQAERRKSQMQTLGLNNGVVNNNRSQRVSAAGINVKDIFEGHQNMAYEHDEGGNIIDPNGVRMQSLPRTPTVAAPEWNE